MLSGILPDLPIKSAGKPDLGHVDRLGIDI
jgi:hypothetical protein